MPKIRRILCRIDFSEFSERAYRHALSLAQHCRAKLFVQRSHRAIPISFRWVCCLCRAL
jgi:hypothetical protein